MRLLVSGNPAGVRDLAVLFPDHVGHLLSPGNGNSARAVRATGLPWGCDNGAFSGFDRVAFLRLLGRLRGVPGCLWVAGPDRVGDARTTLGLFDLWQPCLARDGWPVALVGQDGAEDLDLPWDRFQCYFVGGSTRWKLSQASADLCGEARSRGKGVHMGRVNSLRRLRTAWHFGCDSVDGSSYSRWAHRAKVHRPDMALVRHLRFVASLEGQAERQRTFW